MADTFNPILQIRELKPLSTSNPSHSPAPGKAIVLAGRSQPLLVIRYGESRGLTIGQLMLGKYNRFYEIDVTEHQFNFDESLQSKDNFTAFRASVSLACYVRDPALIVEHNITDALGVIRPAIVDEMRNVAVRYSINEMDIVRDQMRQISLARTHGGFLISRFSVDLALTEKLEQAIHDEKLDDRRTDRAKALIGGGLENLLSKHLANHPDAAIEIAKLIYDQRQKDYDRLKEAASNEDPETRALLLRNVTGEPIAKLTNGSQAKNGSSDSDYDIFMADDDEPPEEFK